MGRRQRKQTIAMSLKEAKSSDVATPIDKSNSIRIFISDVAIGKTPKEANYSDVAEGSVTTVMSQQ